MTTTMMTVMGLLSCYCYCFCVWRCFHYLHLARGGHIENDMYYAPDYFYYKYYLLLLLQPERASVLYTHAPSIYLPVRHGPTLSTCSGRSSNGDDDGWLASWRACLFRIAACAACLRFALLIYLGLLGVLHYYWTHTHTQCCCCVELRHRLSPSSISSA